MINLKQHPKALAKLSIFIKRLVDTWIVEAMGEGMEENELSQEYINNMTESLILSQPRLLYDFLDDNHIHLQPHLLEQLNPEKGWVYELSTPKGHSDEETTFKTRKDAEVGGFNHALAELEELL